MDRIRAHAAELAKFAPDVILERVSLGCGIETGDHVDSGRLRGRERPGRPGHRPEHRKTGRQPHGLQLGRLFGARKGDGAAQSGGGRQPYGVMFNPDTYPDYETYLKSFRSDQPTFKFEVTEIRVRADPGSSRKSASLREPARR